MLQPGDQFDVTLTAPGVYDYFCAPHEQAGMVGRLVVGQPIGPGSQPFEWFRGRIEGRDWLPVPQAARKTFPPIDEIMRHGSVLAKLTDLPHYSIPHVSWDIRSYMRGGGIDAWILFDRLTRTRAGGG
jgi:hypothetical protein